MRPILIGRDACMPDYGVLLATLGAFELIGLSGLVMGWVIATLPMVAWNIFGDLEPSAR